ncbi:MAG: HAMP domain-containing protein [Deltaproteobacteria bacterium]|nr:HAMP domain-containing protein [Deltaproteobacteria bacterium]
MRMTIAKKLWLSFGILILVLGVSGAISYVQIQKLNQALKLFLSVQEPLEDALLEMEVNIGEGAISILAFARDGNRVHIENIHQFRNNFETFLTRFNRLADTDSEKKFGQEITLFFSEYQTLSKKIIARVEARKLTQKAFTELADQLQHELEAFEKSLLRIRRILNEDIQPLIRQDTEKMAEDAIHHGAVTLSVTLALTLFVLMAMGVVTWFTTRGIIRSVRQLKDGSEAFGRGNLDHRIEPTADDELKDVATAFNQMAEKRKIAESQVQESADKIKLFSYSISHDLKSPAIGIHGLAMLLQKQSEHLLDDKGKRTCDQIVKTSALIEELVNHINAFISTREAPLSLEKIPMGEVVEVIRDEVSARLEAAGIKWSQPEQLPEIKADRLSMIRVIRNLVDNALKYGGDGLKHISLGHDETETHHIFSVTDDGAGLREEDLEGIFEVFKRKKSAQGTQGTGLGLPS